MKFIFSTENLLLLKKRASEEVQSVKPRVKKNRVGSLEKVVQTTECMTMVGECTCPISQDGMGWISFLKSFIMQVLMRML